MENKKVRSVEDDLETEEYIRRKMREAADAYEQKLNEDPALSHVQLTDEMRAQMKQLIAQETAKAAAAEELPAAAALSEEDRAALELGRKAMRIHRHRRKFRLAAAMAGVLVLLFGLSMNIQASRLWWINLWNFMLGKEAVFRVDSIVGSSAIEGSMDEVYADIMEKTGIHSVKFLYQPKELIFQNYVVDDVLKTAKLFYEYQETVFTVNMTKKLLETRSTRIFDGEVQETLAIETEYGTMNVMEIAAPGGELDYVAEMVYDNCQYEIYGILPKEEFLNIVKELVFY